MDVQLLAFGGFVLVLCFAFWLMFGSPGNRQPSGRDPGNFEDPGESSRSGNRKQGGNDVDHSSDGHGTNT